MLDMMIIRRAAAQRGMDEGDSGLASDDGRAMGPFDLPAGARVERDLAYRSDPAQRLDVCLPRPSARQSFLWCTGAPGGKATRRYGESSRTKSPTGSARAIFLSRRTIPCCAQPIL